MIFALWFLSVAAFAQDTSRLVLEGQVRERGTRDPVADQNIFVLPHKLKAVTDSAGRFRVENVPAGEITWVVNRAGYKKLEQSEKVDASSATRSRVLSIEKNTYAVYETTVVGKLDKRDDTQRTLKKSEFLNLPGSGGDPLKGIQNLPGVNRALPFTSQVIIQGSAPQDTRYQIDGHEVPIIFHFGGLSSVVLPEALDSVNYLSAGYGPEYGRAMGGIVGVTTQVPEKKRWRGFGFADVYNAGGLVEGPVGKKSSISAGARTSYIGPIMKAVVPDDDGFAFTVAPSFSDFISVFDSELTTRDRFRLTTVGSFDRLTFLVDSPVGRDPNLRFDNRTAFFRLIPQLTHRHGERTVSRFSFGFGRDFVSIDLSSQYFDLKTWALTARGEIEHRFNAYWLSQWGYDNRYSWATVKTKLLSAEGGVERQLDITGSTPQIGLYWRNELKFWKDSPLVVMPHFRLEYFPTIHQTIPEPRLAIRYVPNESWLIRASGGLYTQPPSEQETDSTFGNSSLKAPLAWHGSASVGKDWRKDSRRGVNVTLGSFYRFFDRLVVRSTDLIESNGTLIPENYNNGGKGRAYGGELMTKFEYAPINGWLSYTLSRSTRWTPTEGEHVYNYDQTHLLTAILGWEVGKNWRIGTRFRFVTGNPTTPVSGAVYDADVDSYKPAYGPAFSTRLDPFMQWDIRIDRRFIFKNWILSMYLDIQNVTNRKNAEMVQYAYDYSQSAEITGLPILPLFGLKAEF